MSLNAIIEPMRFELVKASIASLLATERDEQAVLLATAGKTQAEIDNNYDFNVFKDMFALPDAGQLPCVNIYDKGGSFDPSKGYTDSKWHTYELAVDCYSISTAEPDSDADVLAAARLNYLWAQVFQILGSEEHWHKGLKDIVRTTRFTNWQQTIVTMGSNDTAEQILAVQANLELQFEEPTERVLGETLEEIVASLEIDDQFISPFVTALIS